VSVSALSFTQEGVSLLGAQAHPLTQASRVTFRGLASALHTLSEALKLMLRFGRARELGAGLLNLPLLIKLGVEQRGEIKRRLT
jgi:hypothetical protein